MAIFQTKNRQKPEPASKPRSNWIRLTILIALASAIILGACSEGGGAQDPTLQALASEVAATATAAAASAFDPGANLQTAEAQATRVIESLAATQAAQAALSQELRAATATAFAPILSELPKYGVDPAKGRPGWVHPPLQLHVEGYRQMDFGNQFLGTVAEDFVVSVDITWNTRFGTSGCGLLLRSDGNTEAPSHYAVIATRGSNGHVILSTMAQGNTINGYDIYAYGLDPEFDWRNDSTNQLTVVGRGDVFTIYTNGTKIGEINPTGPPPLPGIPPAPTEPPDDASPEVKANYDQAVEEYNRVVAGIRADHRARQEAYEEHGAKFDRGFIAMVALNESGYTDCQFENGWLWLIEE